jgi:hypothetical protein
MLFCRLLEKGTFLIIVILYNKKGDIPNYQTSSHWKLGMSLFYLQAFPKLGMSPFILLVFEAPDKDCGVGHAGDDGFAVGGEGEAADKLLRRRVNRLQ